MITVVVGAQYGGEGKGKVSAYLAWADKIDLACRCGGPNSSHTVVWRNREYRLRMMPTAAVINPQVEVLFGAGTLIHIPTLFLEMHEIGFNGKLVIDPNAGIVTDEIIEQQRRDPRYNSLGSTLTGTGYASAMRCLRTLKLAAQFPELSSWLGNVASRLHDAISRKRKVLIEGHQGFGLSSYHGNYPYSSSRDSTAASMLSEVGIGPIQRDLRVVLAAKLFPTRNHSGNLGEEISVAEADDLGIHEHGGGAWGIPNVRRRVGLIDPAIIRAAVIANSASEIAITGADYFDKTLSGSTDPLVVSRELQYILNLVRKQTDCRVRYVSTGAATDAMIDLAGQKKPKTSKDATESGRSQLAFFGDSETTGLVH